MPQEQGAAPSSRSRRLDLRAFTIWGGAAALSVLLLFHVLHETMSSHALAIITSGVGGMMVGALGYRWTSAESSLGGPAIASLAGGGLGLLVLHLLPLLH
jgi:hypothetical protein